MAIYYSGDYMTDYIMNMQYRLQQQRDIWNLEQQLENPQYRENPDNKIIISTNKNVYIKYKNTFLGVNNGYFQFTNKQQKVTICAVEDNFFEIKSTIDNNIFGAVVTKNIKDHPQWFGQDKFLKAIPIQNSSPEKFNIHRMSNGKYVIKSKSNGNYLQSDFPFSFAKLESNTIGDWEMFDIEI